MEPNLKFKKFRKNKSLTQSQLADILGVSQGTITDIKRGRIKVSKNVLKKITEKFNVESGYFNDGIQLKNNNTNQGAESGYNQGEEDKKQNLKEKYKRNLSFIHKFRTLIKEDYPDIDQMSKDVVMLFSMIEILESLHESKIGQLIFYGTEKIGTETSYNTFKNNGLRIFNDVRQHKEIIAWYAEASREFVIKLNEVKDQIDLDFDLEDYL